MIVSLLALALAAPVDRSTCFDPSRGYDTHFEPINDHTILVRTQRRAFKLTTSPAFALAGPSPVIISQVRGPTEVCQPVDLQLSVTESADAGRGFGLGFGQPIIVQSIEAITLDEAKVLSRTRGKR